ncbi:hypothetical protein R3P93_20030 [Rhodococcus cerastii]|uniref:Uncharacterized protein n=1 Tax=Rhodococcus cerastii TaxID=908616 RepID=A0ABU4D540_9NOCA|nr:hypothetical protein [Rhodococcus cerastii]MDV6304857.1 hypothetical protein [Rhodococcus cerastii]
MTDDTETTTAPPAPPREDRDQLLTRIVTLFNLNSEAEVGITLTVSGVVVSGTLVSGARYFDAANETWSKGDLAAIWSLEVEHYRQLADGTDRADLSTEIARTGYIHLLDAVVHEGGRQLGVAAWRGRLTEVSGWSLGALRAGPPDSE